MLYQKGRERGKDNNEMASQTRRIVNRRIRNGTKKKQMPPTPLSLGTFSVARNIEILA